MDERQDAKAELTSVAIVQIIQRVYFNALNNKMLTYIPFAHFIPWLANESTCICLIAAMAKGQARQARSNRWRTSPREKGGAQEERGMTRLT